MKVVGISTSPRRNGNSDLLLQRALAGAADLAASYLAEIETGRKRGSAAAIRRLAKVLQVDMEDLVGEPQLDITDEQ